MAHSTLPSSRRFFARARSLAVWLLLGASCAVRTADHRELARRLGEAHVAAGKSARDRSGLSHAGLEHLESESDRRRTLIEAELQEPGLPEWAGRYARGDGLGINVSLWVAPRAGAVYTWHGCMGLYDANYGRILEAGVDRLRLDLAVDPRRNQAVYYDADQPRPCMSSEWVFVRWGENRYLIPSTLMISFCNEVNSGQGWFGGFALQQDRERPRMTRRSSGVPGGLPSVPREYQPFLLAVPIAGTIVEAGSAEVIGSYAMGQPKYQAAVRVDAGSKAGLLPGMVLHVVDERGRGEGEVVRVEEDSSTVEFRFSIRNEERDVPRAGWAVSTRWSG